MYLFGRDLRRICLTGFLWGLVPLFHGPAARGDEATSPITPPTIAANSLAKLSVRPGMKVELVAAEPLVRDPVDIAWGADGRLWVVEMADYPEGMDGKGKPGGRIRFLEDTNGDSVYDRSTLFLDEIPFPTSVMPWHHGVLITAAPHIFFAADTTGDGRADHRETLYSGFGEGNQQHRVNSLRYGLDHWIYLSNGDSDGEIRSMRTGEMVDVRGRDLRIRPDDGRIEAQTGRAQFGRNRDDWGNWFGCNNSNPMWHYALADEYLRRNPFVMGHNAIVQIAPHAAPVFPISETLARFNDLDRANRFTSACGAMIYRDHLLGSDVAGNGFVCEPVHNLVHRLLVEPHGTTFKGQRAADEQQSEFLASSDHWFRPTAVHTGPDGALYVVDMYRAVIEHPRWIPEEWLAKLDVRAGEDRGRIYRVLPVDAAPRAVPRLADASVPQLVAALESPNGPTRDLAQQLLIERNDPAAVQPLYQLLQTSPQPLARLHALCTLDALGQLNPTELRTALADKHPGVRRHAVRLVVSKFGVNDEWYNLGELVVQLADDDDPHVRMQVAYTLGDWPTSGAKRALAKLLVNSGDDPFVLAAALSSINDNNIDGVLQHVISTTAAAPGKSVALERLAALASAMGHMAAIERALDTILIATDDETQLRPWRFRLLAAMLEARDASNRSLRDLLSTANEVRLGRIDALAASARDLSADESAPLPRRVGALRLLARDPQSRQDDIELLVELLGPQHPLEMQRAALDSLARVKDDSIAELLLENFSQATPGLRGHLADVLLSRKRWTDILLNHLERGELRPLDLDADRRQRLLGYKNKPVRERAAQLLASVVGDADRRKVVDQLQSVLTLKGTVEKGRQVFVAKCSVCHQAGGVGHEVGPNLAALKDRSPSIMLVHILDPNRAVEDKYLGYVAATDDGLVVSGVLAAETSASITLKAQEGKEVVLRRNQIEDLRSTGKSLMPEGFEKDLSPQDLADVIAYVANLTDKTDETAAPLVVAARAPFTLTAAAGRPVGPAIKFMPEWQAFGWFTAEDRVEWQVKLPEEQTYEVTLEWSVSDKAAGKPFRLKCDHNEIQTAGNSQPLVGKIAPSGGWEEFKIGTVGQLTIPAGVNNIVFEAAEPFDGPLLDLRSLSFKPVGR